MKRKIRSIALILCFVLAFSLMCGCGGKEQDVAAPPSAEETDDGKGDLIEEEEPADVDEESAVNTLALRGPSYTGLTQLEKVNNDDGTYLYQDMTEDGLTVITNMSSHASQSDGQDPDAYAENFVCAVVDDTDSAKITSSKADETVSEGTTYPSYRVYWETGSNEDSRQNVGVVVLTDGFTFYYGYGCPADFYDENADFYEGELNSVTLIDLADLGSESSAEADAGESDGGYGVYLDKMNDLKSKELADQFTLAFINDDGRDIPELIASDSKGSFDHENAFIFTYQDGEVVEVASAITGVDGANLDYAIGANLIHISGAAAGMRDAFYRIENGKLEEVFVAEATSMDDDAKFSINGESVKKDDYYKQIDDFMRPYNPLVRIAYDGLYDVTYTYNDGYGGFEQGSMENYSR